MKKSRVFEWFFHKDSLMIGFAVVSFWFTVSLAIPQFIEKADLTRHEGAITDAEIVITKIKNKPLFKDTTRQMRVFLEGSNDYFILPGNDGYHEYDSLFITDSVEIYTKERTWGIFGFDPRIVYQMVRKSDKRVFVNFADRKKSNSGLWLITGVFTIVLIFWYTIKTIRRMQ